MGENPSYFHRVPCSAEHPVETVSWEDCARFFERINREIPASRQLLAQVHGVRQYFGDPVAPAISLERSATEPAVGFGCCGG